MRTTRPLDALFPRTRQAILATTFLDAGREWYLHDLARAVRLPPSSLQREVANLVDAGLLRCRRDGNRVYYRAEEGHPIYGDLRGLLLKTAGLRDVLLSGLAGFGGRIRVAFVFGSVARGEENSSSDIDLMVIGDVKLSELVPRLKEAEDVLHRPVNPLVYPPGEVARKLGEGHHFLTRVMGEEKLYIVGDEHDLEAALGREASQRPHDDEA